METPELCRQRFSYLDPVFIELNVWKGFQVGDMVEEESWRFEWIVFRKNELKGGFYAYVIKVYMD